MPRAKNLTDLPALVAAANRAFGSPLRVALIRHYHQHPGPQALAVDALGESSANVSRNTQVLMDTGVVTTDGREYRVDAARVWTLAGSVADYVLRG